VTVPVGFVPPETAAVSLMSPPTMTSSEAVVEIPIASQAEADQMAKAMFNDMALGLICGEGEAVGNTSLKAGITISLLGLGDRFNGVYYVRQAEHRIGPKVGYVTKFNVVRNTS